MWTVHEGCGQQTANIFKNRVLGTKRDNQLNEVQKYISAFIVQAQAVSRSRESLTRRAAHYGEQLLRFNLQIGA